MGLFKFIKEAGAKLFGGSAKADEISTAVKGTGIDPGSVTFDKTGDTVKVTGEVMSREAAERMILAIGNTVGVAEVDVSQLLVKDAAPAAEFYTVQKGDTLWAIAEKFYGKGQGAKYTEIVKANSPPVKNPDLIQPGWVLRIPKH